MDKINVTIKGITPLLQERFSNEKFKEQTKKSTGEADYSKDAEKALYQLEDGTIYQPAVHLERAIAEAGKNFKPKGHRGNSYSRLLGSALEITPECIPHKFQEWVQDERTAVIRTIPSKPRIMVYRPRFDEWELSFTIHILDDGILPDQVRKVLDWAGLYNGLGGMRPQHGHRFGKFIIIEWQEITE